MHELSIALRVVELAAARCREAAADEVTAVRLRVGRLAMVHAAALESAFAIAREGTPLEHATLEVIDVPVRVWCADCSAEADLVEIVPLACPACGRPTGDLRAGRDLEIESIAVRATPCSSRETPP